jgi:Outer membrane protein beta-barrel domain
MKHVRWVLVVLAMSVTAGPAMAKPEIGVIAGVNLANLSIEDAHGLDLRSTFAAGGVVDFSVSDRFGIRVEPMFLSKGAKATQRNAYWSTIDGVWFDLDYIEVPVLARFHLVDTGPGGFLLAGLGFGFATGQNVELQQGTANETVDFQDVFSSFDLSLTLGAGFSVPVGEQRMTFDTRFAMGLLDINEGGTVTFNGAPLDVPSNSTTTLDIRFFATYLFPLGK